jgi:hypothetical protein
LDIKAYQKCKAIAQLIKCNIEDRLDKEWQGSGVAQEMNAINWPREVKKIFISDEQLSKDSKLIIKKNLRVRT